MSSRIVLNTWSGSDQDLAAEKMARVFRMTEARSAAIIQQLLGGRNWEFEHKVSDPQARTAAAYLKRMGFQVDIRSGNGAGTETAEAPPTREPEESGPRFSLGFNGRGGELFSIQILNMIKTVFTLGIYKFWAKTRVRQYLWSNTSFAGDRFAYHGTGMELFRGFVKFSSLLIVLVGSMAVLQLYGGPAGKTAADVIVLLLVFLGFPALMVGAWRYRLTRTSWRGIRFSFRGTRKQAVLLYLKGIFFMGLTLGLYWPFFKMEWEQFWRENSWFGDRKLEFTGTGKDLFGRYVLALLLTPLTLGLYWFWFKASLQRYLWSHTRFVGGRFRFTATGGQVLALNFVNLLILIVTLGLGLAWVIVRNQQFLADHLFLQGDVRLNQVVQEMRESGALGEEALDAMDVPLEIGI